MQKSSGATTFVNRKEVMDESYELTADFTVSFKKQKLILDIFACNPKIVSHKLATNGLFPIPILV